jgi:hypothetical protein
MGARRCASVRSSSTVTGVSLKLALPHTAEHLTLAGFRLIVPRDAVGGTPPSYAQQVLTHSIAVLGKLTTVDELVASWSADARQPAPSRYDTARTPQHRAHVRVAFRHMTDDAAERARTLNFTPTKRLERHRPSSLSGDQARGPASPTAPALTTGPETRRSVVTSASRQISETDI